MRKILTVIILASLLFPLSAVTYAYDPDIGLLTKGDAGLIAALKEEFSLEWVEEYVSPSFIQDFSAMYGGILPSVLPLEDVLMSGEDGTVSIKDRSKGIIMTVFLNGEGQIESLSVSQSAPQAEREDG